MTGEQVKTMLDSFYEACDAMENSPIGKTLKEQGLKSSIRDVLRVNLTSFVMQLSAADGYVGYREANFIQEYFGWNLLPSQIQESIDDQPKFLEEVPLIFNLFVRTDKVVYQHSETETELGQGSRLLMDFFESVGQLFIACDDDVDDDEVSMLTAYISMLREYRSSELESVRTEKAKEKFVEKNDALDSSEEETLEELLEQLENLTGLAAVKRDVSSLINLIKIRKIREDRGIPQAPMSMHLVFSGNPGTGKTTVARLLSKIYCKLGLLSKGHLTEVDRSGLVGGYVGQTAIKVKEVIDKALGGILFIDEAYSLTANRSENDYGIEAVDTLLKGMEDHRNNLIVIVAGYPDLMQQFLDSNPGLRSRFNKFINFPDYTPEELQAIFESMCKNAGYTLSPNARNTAMYALARHYHARSKNFANARDVRNYFEQAVVNQANRLAAYSQLTDDMLTRLEVEDIEKIKL